MADHKIYGNNGAGNVQALDYDRRQVAHLQAVVDRLNAVIDKHNTDCEDLRAQLAAANARADQAEYRIVHIAAGLFPGGFDNNVAAIRDALRNKPAPEVTVEIDLLQVMFAQLCEAAKQSNWIPQEHYYANDWISDCCDFLRTGRGAIAPPEA